MSNWFVGLLDRSFAVGGALVTAQVPMFIQQYTHQLAGRVAELKLHADAIARAAALGGKSPSVYVNRFLVSGDPDFVRQGELMQWMGERYISFSEAYERLTHASVLSKPWIFVQEFNFDIAKLTFHDFQAGVPFTLETIAYALVGVAFGYGLFLALSSFFSFCYQKFISLWKSLKLS